MNDDTELTVVIAAQEPSAALRDGLRSFHAQLEGSRAQILVAARSAWEGLDDAVALAPGAELILGKPGMLVPDLWRLGIERARGRLVALSIDRCVPRSDWADTLFRLAEDHPEAAGYGGPIAPPVGGSARDWAAYLVRYSSYLGQAAGSCDEIPGDNAVYRLADLEHDWTDRAEGFWETIFHRRLRRRGRELRFEPRLQVRLASTEQALSFAHLRLRHGRHFGSTRPLSSWLLRPLAALAAPALTPLLLARIRRRLIDTRPEWLPHLRRAIPWLLLYLGAWSVGEALGYLRRRRVR